MSENSNVAMRAEFGRESGGGFRSSAVITAAKSEQWARRGPWSGVRSRSTAPGFSLSRGASIALEQSTQPLVDCDLGTHVWGRSIRERLVADALMRTLGVVVRDVLVDGLAERVVSEDSNAAMRAGLGFQSGDAEGGLAIGDHGRESRPPLANAGIRELASLHFAMKTSSRNVRSWVSTESVCLA